MQVITASSAVSTTPFEVAYDQAAPQITAFTINPASLTNAYLAGTSLYYGPQCSGTVEVSLQASDGTGVREVTFPGLFQEAAETLPGGTGSAEYAKTYAVDGASDTMAGSFEITVTDRVGNASQQTVTIVKDVKAPVVEFTMPTAVPLEYTATWQPTEAEAGIAAYTVRAYDAGMGQWKSLSLTGDQVQLDLTGGTAGIIQLEITAVDRVGNVSGVETWTASGWQAATKYYPFGGQVVAVRHAKTGVPLDAGTLSYLVTDHLGSTSLVVDPSGEVVAQTRYEPFGEVRWSGGVEPTEKGYTGQRSEDYIKLVDFGSRWYDPALGRFISPDSIVPGNYNPLAYDRYAYVANNPTAFIDPSGHCWGFASGMRDWTFLNYGTTCNNLDMALTIIQSENTSAGEKAIAIGYVAGEGAAHGTLVTGAAMLACSAVAPCAEALSSALGISTSFSVINSNVKNLWEMPPFSRGNIIEDLLGRSLNLVKNFPVIDRFINGVATSIKSINLGAKTHQDLDNLRRTIQGYVNTLANWQGANWGGVRIDAQMIQARELLLAIPPNASQAQLDALQELQTWAQSVGVTITITIVK